MNTGTINKELSYNENSVSADLQPPIF
jgi:hypothetical protein